MSKQNWNINGFNEGENTNIAQYCSPAFLDTRQDFDKFWYSGLLYKT